jgi:hypothetical protein
MSKNNIIPSPYTTVTEYEKYFVTVFEKTISNGMFDLLKKLSEITKQKNNKK